MLDIPGSKRYNIVNHKEGIDYQEGMLRLKPHTSCTSQEAYYEALASLDPHN